MNLLDVEIQTKRLVLKTISMRDKKEIFSEFTEEIVTYMCASPPQHISETELFINEALEELRAGTDLQLVVLAQDSHEFLGCAGLHNLQENPQLGIWLKKSAHGKKYGLETIVAIKQWADENLNYEYLVYPVDRANTASRKIPEALGGRVVRTSNEVNDRGGILHLVEYRVYKV